MKEEFKTTSKHYAVYFQDGIGTVYIDAENKISIYLKESIFIRIHKGEVRDRFSVVGKSFDYVQSIIESTILSIVGE